MDTKTLVGSVADKINRTPEDVEFCIKCLQEILVEKVMNGDVVSMPGFGTFESKLKESREVFHPSTGKRLLVPPKASLVFKPSAILKQKVRK